MIFQNKKDILRVRKYISFPYPFLREFKDQKQLMNKESIYRKKHLMQSFPK